MFSRSIRLSATLLFLGTSSAYAQYTSVADSEKQAAVRIEEKMRAAQNALIGTQFWVVPNPHAFIRLVFEEDISTSSSSSSQFVLTDTVSFKVVGFEKGRLGSDYVRIEFSDGKIAYLPQSGAFDLDFKTASLFRNVATKNDPCYDFQECLFTQPPEQLRLAAKARKAKAAAAAAAWKARGGVSIGMTASQVLASNWGKPKKVNRTSGRFGTHEQWVYGGTNYLYLQNGVVTAIQN